MLKPFTPVSNWGGGRVWGEYEKTGKKYPLRWKVVVGNGEQDD